MLHSPISKSYDFIQFLSDGADEKLALAMVHKGAFEAVYDDIFNIREGQIEGFVRQKQLIGDGGIAY